MADQENMRKMIRKQVYLEPSQNHEIKLASNRRNTTEAQIIRDAIESYLVVTADPLLQLIGIAETRKTDGSVMHDRDLLQNEEVD